MNLTDARTKTATALRRAIDEHGAPNNFYPGELAAHYGAPAPTIQGRIERVRAPSGLEGAVIKGCRVTYAHRTWVVSLLCCVEEGAK